MRVEKRLCTLFDNGILTANRLGHVYRVFSRGKRIKPKRIAVNSTGKYFILSNIVDGKRYTTTLHRVLWQYFNGDIPEGYDINHLNGIQRDNRLENLEVCTRGENIRHAFRTGLNRHVFGVGHGRALLNDLEVIGIRRLISIGVPIKEIGRYFGVGCGAICHIKAGVTWKHIL